jgi:hypothetical protein
MVEAGTSDALFTQIDLYASLAHLVGQNIAKDAAPDSRDFLNTLLGTDRKGRDYVIEASPQTLSVTDGRWHYIAPSNGPAYNKLTNIELGNAPHDQLYYLKTDVGEQDNVAAKYPKIVRKMKRILDKETAKGCMLGK